MPDKKISAMSLATTPLDPNAVVVPVVQAGVTARAPVGAFGGLLTYISWVQAANYTYASVTFADIDAAHLIVTFTAPASGKVIVRLIAVTGPGASGAAVLWDLRDSGGDVANSKVFVCSGTGANANYAVDIPMAGLTPGTSYTWKWGWAAGSANTITMYGTTATGAANSAFIMEVWSVPA
jgi:hypothetical protein